MTTRLETFAKLPGIGRVVIRCIDWLGRIRGKHLCEEAGCLEWGSYCELEDESFYYCYHHAKKAGFCWSCGNFWAGIESFDFGRSGLCEVCEDQMKCDMGEYDDEEYDFAP